MIHRAPPQEMGVLHLPESVLDVVLRAISQHNVCIQPVGVIGEQNGAFKRSRNAEAALGKFIDGLAEWKAFTGR
jgi:hypothetical protein